MKNVLTLTRNLTDAALNWAVAVCIGHNPEDIRFAYGCQGPFVPVVLIPSNNSYNVWDPCHDRAQGGPIAHEHRISIHYCQDLRDKNGLYVHAESDAHCHHGYWYGDHDNPLTAALRCYLHKTVGDQIEIPECLIT